MRNETRLKKLEVELGSGEGAEVVVVGIDWGSPETNTVTFVTGERAGETILLSEFNRLFPDCKVHRVMYDDTEGAYSET